MDHAPLNKLSCGNRKINSWLAFTLLLFALTGQTQKLPEYYVTVNSGQLNGFYFFSPIKLGAQGAASLPIDIILDHNGKVVYYRQYGQGRFSGGLRLQKNGLMSFFFEDKFYLMDSTFTVIDSIFCKNGLLQDAHDLQILPNGHFLMIGYEHIEMDLSSFNFFNKNGSPGNKKAKVKCDVIQELDVHKNVVFEWHGKDHYSFDDVDPYYFSNPDDVDWTHFNAVESDREGNILISVKPFNEITKISRSDGKILWRLGGKRNQFTFLNDTLGFKGQHDIRQIPNGNITLFDNGYPGKPVHPEGAKEYQLDEVKLTAKLVWSHINHPTGYSPGYGNVQRIANGNTMINYGRCDELKPIFNIVSPAGARLFEIASNDSVRNYRAYYYPALPWKLKRPEITQKIIKGRVYLDAGAGHKSYLWSTGDTTQLIPVNKAGILSVFVPFGPGGFISSPPYTVTHASLPSEVKTRNPTSGKNQNKGPK